MARVFTKQHENVLRELNEAGRYAAKREYAARELEEHAPLMLAAYDWLVEHAPNASQRPPDADYPVWVSFSREAAMLPEPGTVMLELEVEEPRLARVNINKWGTILNYSYIPSDPCDAARHRLLMEQCGVSDAKAYMSRFYPELRREIITSWDRLFDGSVLLGSGAEYGILWEVRKEWVTQIIA